MIIGDSQKRAGIYTANKYLSDNHLEIGLWIYLTFPTPDTNPVEATRRLGHTTESEAHIYRILFPERPE